MEGDPRHEIEPKSIIGGLAWRTIHFQRMSFHRVDRRRSLAAPPPPKNRTLPLPFLLCLGAVCDDRRRRSDLDSVVNSGASGWKFSLPTSLSSSLRRRWWTLAPLIFLLKGTRAIVKLAKSDKTLHLKKLNSSSIPIETKSIDELIRQNPLVTLGKTFPFGTQFRTHFRPYVVPWHWSLPLICAVGPHGNSELVPSLRSLALNFALGSKKWSCSLLTGLVRKTNRQTVLGVKFCRTVLLSIIWSWQEVQ